MASLKVADVMTRGAVAVRETASYKQIADTLVKHGISAVPVLDAADHVVGVVSEADLLHKIEFRGDEAGRRLFERRRHRIARAKASQDRAAELMSAPAITILPGVSVVEAARRMEAGQVKRLPVTDELGRLVGIVSRRDLMRVFLRPDNAIRDELIEHVLHRGLWRIPGEIRVGVADGVVTLTGSVERTSMIEQAVRLAASVDGVVDVVNQLTARQDDALEQNLEAMTRPLVPRS